MASGTASLDALYTAFGQLRQALDTHDATAINVATRAVRAATDDVRGQGAWKMDDELREKLEGLQPMIEAARVRVNLASDDVRQRISLLGRDANSSASAHTYGR